MPHHKIDKEYRAAVVFYGGVSLAVYENGVARAFFDACRGRGAFAPLLRLLRGRFVVDVVSGSSAGGINGLLLSAALEHGTEFSQTAKLWREAGGFDALLRPVGEAEGAASLLRGESYYLEQLRHAFRQLCTTVPPNTTELHSDHDDFGPKEIDVYVTGTDLTGQRKELLDGVGSRIETRDHRLIFHLKHRRYRTRLGLVRSEQLAERQKLQLQSDILASVARITSSFPGAFPPFTTKELGPFDADERPLADTRERVLGALERLAAAPLEHEGRGHALIDGGVLDNKPFGPVLDSIFHRLPSERGWLVDRKLYYVEPDPVPFEQRFAFTPFEVLIEALGPLPMYDSIAADLRALEEHNGRIRRYKALRECALRAVRRGASSVQSRPHHFAYCTTLRQSIACMLLGVAPNEANAAARLDRTVGSMSEWLDGLNHEDSAPQSKPASECDWDIAFHLRRAYFALYAEDESGARLVREKQRYWLGRIVKALKLLRDVWLAELRAAANAPVRGRSQGLDDETAADLVERRFPVLRRYLAGDWIDPTTLQELIEAGVEGLTSKQLQRLHESAAAWLRRELRDESRAPSTPPTRAPESPSVGTSGETPTGANRAREPASHILQWLGTELRRIVPAPTDPNRLHVVDEFERIDPCVYPAEFAAELYELDEVNVVRISPKDAKIPGVRVRDKITGDELAHFSAFLRKDWRTNDLAWGHVDGLCQIARALLPDSAAACVARSLREDEPALRRMFTHSALREQFAALLEATQRDKVAAERLTVDDISGLDDACQRVERAFEAFAAWACQPTQDEAQGRALLGALREAWLSAASIEAMGEYVSWVIADTEHQNRQWRWATGPQRTLEREQDALNQIAGMKLGAAPISEELPDALKIQYGGHIGLLLWGMLEKSLKATGRAEALVKRAGGTLRPLLWSAYYIARSARLERRFASLILLACVIGGLAFALGSALAGASAYAVLALAVVLWFVSLAYTLSQPSLRRAIKLALFGVPLGAVLLVYFHPAVAHRFGGYVVTLGQQLQAQRCPTCGSSQASEFCHSCAASGCVEAPP